MIRQWRALTALLILVPPLDAQVLAGRATSLIVTTPVPAFSAAAPSAFAASPALSPLTPAFLPSAAEGPAGVSILDALREGGSPEESAGRISFDGSEEFSSPSGAIYILRPFKHPAVPGGIALVQSQPAPASTVRSVPGTEGLQGEALLDKVGQIAASHQKTNDYRAASHYIFKTADHLMIGGVSGVVDAYSGVFVPGNSSEGADYPETGDQDGDGYHEKNGMNIEHLWPQSLFEHKLPMRADIHHLMPTFQHPNGVRANLPFGEVEGKPDYQNNAGAKRGGGFFEPPDMTKGRAARGLLYFYSRYKKSSFFNRRVARFWNVQIETLLRWNRQFPPDAQEMRRNDLVEQYQGNRNPFVDDPGLADLIGAEALRAH
ncbi:MAG: hypothetical protein A2X40_10800 [Elusimicrobia bacterium GWC2_65_9]|nr:MAG: hypothetical protein A2X37_03955 [Elusimicrobia bacterium GWA2_66_18]OGR69021.1 MAG: hypothetical protein A2X40_10800 [Elusimicrobia bacterium GWC2_65_9]